LQVFDMFTKFVYGGRDASTYNPTPVKANLRTHQEHLEEEVRLRAVALTAKTFALTAEIVGLCIPK
jgi:hypothetical protein